MTIVLPKKMYDDTCQNKPVAKCKSKAATQAPVPRTSSRAKLNKVF